MTDNTPIVNLDKLTVQFLGKVGKAVAAAAGAVVVGVAQGVGSAAVGAAANCRFPEDRDTLNSKSLNNSSSTNLDITALLALRKSLL